MNVLISLACLLSLMSACCLGAAEPAATVAADPAKPAAIVIGDAVPDFAMIDGSGKSVTLAAWREAHAGQPVALVFWCSTCHSCRNAERAVEALAKEVAGKAGVALLAANRAETVESAASFVRGTKLELPVLLQNTGEARRVFGVDATTTAIVIGADGRLAYRGAFARGDQAAARDALTAVIAGKAPAVAETPQLGCPME